MTRNVIIVINGWFSSSDMLTSVHYRDERDSQLCSLTLSTYPRKVTLPFCLFQGTHFWCAGPYHKIYTYQMADKCSDSVVSVDLENSAFVASNFDCNNCVTYCLDDCIVAVRIVGECVAYCYCAR